MQARKEVAFAGHQIKTKVILALLLSSVIPLLIMVYILHGYIVPLPMMALGLLGACLQAFIFCVLSMVYIALATEH